MDLENMLDDRLEKLLEEDPGDTGEAYRLQKEFLAKLGAVVERDGMRDWKGHYKRGALFDHPAYRSPPAERLMRMLRTSFLFSRLSPEQMRPLVDAVEAGVGLDEPLKFPRMWDPIECPYCGTKLVLGFDGNGLVVTSKPCPHPDGLVTEFELNVPSGKIVVDDDLRTWFPVDEEFDINGMLGTHLSSLTAAKVGMAHGFVGNTCPKVYRAGDDRFVIGSYCEEIWDNEKKEYFENPDGCPWGEQVASICTDLWWYSIADFDDFSRRVAHYTPESTVEEITGHWTVHVVDVRPGVYRFRQVQGIDRDAPVVEYASFEWVREPDPVRDLIKEDMEKRLTATEVLLQHCLAWPTLYMGASSLEEPTYDEAVERWKNMTDEERRHALASSARQVMFTSRADDWHPNGFPRTVLSDEVKQLAAEYGDVPFFDFRAAWGSPSDDYDAICLGAGLGTSRFGPFPDLEPSFVRLGLNVCQNAIRYGEEPRLNKDVYPPAYEVPFARKNMAKFVEAYRAYRKKHPDIVFDEEFDLWMQETDLEKYVAEFDYGVTDPPREEWGKPPVTVKTGRFFEFDASKLSDGSFSHAHGTWARKEDAKRYALGPVEGTQSEMGHLHAYASAYPENLIPLKAVGRVLRGTGDGHSSAHLVVTFDYGTEKMHGQMAFQERDMGAVEQFDDEKRYVDLLEHYKIAYAKLAATDAEPSLRKKKAVKKKARNRRKKRRGY